MINLDTEIPAKYRYTITR